MEEQNKKENRVKVLKFSELRNGINMNNMHLFMACVSLMVLLVHVVFFCLMMPAL